MLIRPLSVAFTLQTSTKTMLAACARLAARRIQSTNTAQCLRAASAVLSLRSLSNSVRQVSRPAAYFQRRHMSDVGKAAPWTPPPRPAPGQDGYVAKDKIRNVAIIAHVDHGKTTLVDGLLRQSEYGDRISSNDRVMDSNALEQERGITIMSKATRVDWNGYTLNIVDTPGHADFGGEVERVLSMVDGVILVIDATEGPMPQTKFVLNKALTHKLKPILVINKCDRTQARIFSGEVQNEAFDLFVQLGADDSQLEFPILYATARHGWATEQLDNVTKWMNLPEPPKRDVANLTPLYQAIVKHVPPPVVRSEGDFSMLVTSVEYDNYVGKVCTGRIYSGTAKPGDVLRPVTRAGVAGEPMKVMKVFCRRGTTREELDMATAGDIVSIAGINGMVGDTLTNTESITPLASPPLDAPTIAVTISPNTSPVNGKDGGKHLTAAQIRQRLLRETENNVAIQVFPSPHHADAMEVHGRGELQMGILLETMRREAYEVSVSPPQVLFKEENGKKYEPIEEVVMELSTDQSSIVMDKMKLRSATLMDFKELPSQKARLLYHCPSRTLMGYRSEFKMDTKGTGVMYSIYHSHQEFVDPGPQGPQRGAIISTDQGEATAHALEAVQPRGVLFISPGSMVYEGMVIGEHNRPEDLAVNPTKKKQLTNIRTVMKEDAIRLYPIREITLEESITILRPDEMVEVTPKAIRIRKRILKQDERLRQARLAKGK